MGSSNFNNKKTLKWKSTGTFNNFSDSNMITIKNASGDLSDLKGDGNIYVYLSGNQFQQNKANILNNVVINIYCVYKLDPIAPSRDTTFTIQNALFGAMQITKNADNSKYDYKRIWHMF